MGNSPARTASGAGKVVFAGSAVAVAQSAESIAFQVVANRTNSTGRRVAGVALKAVGYVRTLGAVAHAC